jgi:hypothetical protein
MVSASISAGVRSTICYVVSSVCETNITWHISRVLKHIPEGLEGVEV